MAPNPKRTGVVFGIENDVPQGVEARPNGASTTSGSAPAPCAGPERPARAASTIMTMEDIRLEGQAGRLGTVMTAVVVDGPAARNIACRRTSKSRRPSKRRGQLATVFADIPFGLPNEPTPVGGGSGASRAFSVQGYGLMSWYDLFTSRSVVGVGNVCRSTTS